MFKKVLTNPSEHNPYDFIYLVHGLIDYSGNGITAKDVRGKINKIKSVNEFYRASMIGQMDEDSAKQRVGWHGCELYRMFTFGNVGLIINPASDEDIKIAWYCEMGGPNEPEELKKFVEQHKGKVRSPLYIFTKSMNADDVFGDNEFVIEGNPTTQIQGVFYRDNHQASEKAKMVQDIASEVINSNVQIIQLPDSRLSALSPIEQMALMHQRRQLQGEFYLPEFYNQDMGREPARLEPLNRC